MSRPIFDSTYSNGFVFPCVCFRVIVKQTLLNNCHLFINIFTYFPTEIISMVDVDVHVNVV